MPDITMCTDKECPKKEKCYRYKAIAKQWHQSYFMDSPRNKDTDECEEFVSVEEE